MKVSVTRQVFMYNVYERIVEELFKGGKKEEEKNKNKNSSEKFDFVEKE